MEKFESLAPQKPEANSHDVQRLRTHLEEEGFTHFDNHEAVLQAAHELFSNYAEADVAAVVSSFYQEEQAAALEADTLADDDSEAAQ